MNLTLRTERVIAGECHFDPISALLTVGASLIGGALAGGRRSGGGSTTVNVPPPTPPPTIDIARQREELSRRLRRRRGQQATIKSAPEAREPGTASRVLLGSGG